MNSPVTDPACLSLILGELRLQMITRLWHKFAERADKEGWPATRLLSARVEHELADRSRRRIERHRTESHLPLGKTLGCFDFSMVQMLSKPDLQTLAAGDAWIEKGANLLLFGPPEAGRSHTAAGLGHALIDAGYRVFLARADELVQRLQLARQSLQLISAINKLDRFDLLIVDDIS